MPGFLLAVPGRSLVIGGTMGRRSVVLMELLGAVRTFEFMAFAGHTGKSNGHNEQGKKFHRGAS